MNELSMFSAVSARALQAELADCNRLTEAQGLTLTEGDMRALSRRREEALRDTGRVEFTGGIFRKLAYAFCDSAYITPANYADTLSELVALFYAFKSDIEDEMTDDELIEAMQRIFDGRAQGDLTYLADITLGDYIGMTQDEAAATEQVVSGQISVTWEQEYNSDYAAGYIYKQSPVSGRTVREGQNVTLTVSLGTQYVTVPDLTNYVQADAEQQLKELGVSVLVTQAVDTSVASGAVIRTDPAAGSQVAAGSTVVMYISRPQVATTTKVPSLTGMSTADARTLLVQNHLGLGSQTEQYSDQPVGTVISQNPAAGSTTKLNGRVNIVVSAGPEPAPEPEAPSDSTTGGDWWSGLFGSSSSSSSTETGTEQGTAGSGDPSQKPLTDWWSSLLS